MDNAEMIQKIDKALPFYKMQITHLQNKNGSFPFGHDDIEIEESPEMTASFMMYMDGEKDVETNSENAAIYFTKKFEQLKEDIFENEWTGGKNPKTASLIGLAMGKEMGKDNDVTQVAHRFVEESIPDILGSGFKEHRMQNNFMNALYSMEFLHYMDSLDEKDRLIFYMQNFQDQKDLGFYYPPKDLAYRAWINNPLKKRKNMYKTELTSSFLDIMSRIGERKNKRLVEDAVEYLEDDGADIDRDFPQSVLGKTNALLNHFPQTEFDYLTSDTKNEVIYLTENVTKNIQNRMHAAGGLVYLRNLLKDRP